MINVLTNFLIMQFIKIYLSQTHLRYLLYSQYIFGHLTLVSPSTIGSMGQKSIFCFTVLQEGIFIFISFSKHFVGTACFLKRENQSNNIPTLVLRVQKNCAHTHMWYSIKTPIDRGDKTLYCTKERPLCKLSLDTTYRMYRISTCFSIQCKDPSAQILNYSPWWGRWL